MATKFELLKLSKKELIKKCKKKKITLLSNSSKSKLIDLLLLKHAKEQKLKRTRSKSKSKLLKMNTIPYDNPTTQIKGVCRRLTNNVLLEQTRIKGAYKIRKNILVYNNKSQKFIQKYNIKFTQKYSLDRIWIYGIDLNQCKLFALWCENAAYSTFNKMIEYNLSNPKWTEKDDLSITFNFKSHYQPHIIMTSDQHKKCHKYHIFKYYQNKMKYQHMIRDEYHNKIHKCHTFNHYAENIFYDDKLNTIFMIDFEYSKFKFISINIYWLQLDMDMYIYKWEQAVIDIRDKEDIQFNSIIDQWCIVNGNYFIVFYGEDESIKYVDFIAMSDFWRICEYKLPEKFIIPPTSKFDKRRVFVTDDGIIHFFRNNDGSKDKIYHFKDKDGLKSQHHRIALENIDYRLCDDEDKWIILIYGFIFNNYDFVPIRDIAQLICQYCFLS
eukprot:373708_1